MSDTTLSDNILCDDIWYEIFLYLEPKEFCHLGATSKRFNHLMYRVLYTKGYLNFGAPYNNGTIKGRKLSNGNFHGVKYQSISEGSILTTLLGNKSISTVWY